MVKFNQVTTINDCKTPVPLSAPFEDVAEYFMPTILMEMDYFPFGMKLFEPGTLGDYRFGFGGQERDDEIKGSGNHYRFGDFGYYPRLGRRWSMDAMGAMFPFISPYSYAMNNPILFIDPDGNIVVISHRDSETKTVLSVQFGTDGKLYDIETGKEYTGDNQYIRQVQTALNNMLEFNNDIVTHVVIDLVTGSEVHSVQNFDFRWDDDPEKKRDYSYNIGSRMSDNPKGSLTKFVPDLDRANLPNLDLSDEEILGHEFKHGYNRKHGMTNPKRSEKSGLPFEEIDGLNFQNLIRHLQGKEMKTEYGGVDATDELTPPSEYKNIRKKE